MDFASFINRKKVTSTNQIIVTDVTLNYFVSFLSKRHQKKMKMGEFLNLCLEIIGSMALFHSETKIIFKIRVDKPLDTFCETCSISQERFHIGSKKDRSVLIHRF